MLIQDAKGVDCIDYQTATEGVESCWSIELKPCELDFSEVRYAAGGIV